jgi:signal peptidase
VPDKDPQRKGYILLLKELLVVGVIIIVILVALFAYSGLWPPVVVVESGSMQHSDTQSSIGTIDTGDIVIVQKVQGSQDVVTYLDGVSNGYKTYGEFGDVVIYNRYGLTERVPIIHRALCKIIYNETGGGYDIPSLASLPDAQWEVQGISTKTCWNLNKVVEIHDIGYLHLTVRLDLSEILKYYSSRGLSPHGGLITMGDHNAQSNGTELLGYYDQLSICREPIRDSWLVGKARGELPWFGLVKLWATNTLPPNTPQNSVTNFFISIVVIIGLPIALDISNVLLKRRGIEIFGWTKKLRVVLVCGKRGDEEAEVGKGGEAMKDADPSEPTSSGQTKTGKKDKGKSE